MINKFDCQTGLLNFVQDGGCLDVEVIEFREETTG